MNIIRREDSRIEGFVEVMFEPLLALYIGSIIIGVIIPRVPTL